MVVVVVAAREQRQGVQTRARVDYERQRRGSGYRSLLLLFSRSGEGRRGRFTSCEIDQSLARSLPPTPRHSHSLTPCLSIPFDYLLTYLTFYPLLVLLPPPPSPTTHSPPWDISVSLPAPLHHSLPSVVQHTSILEPSTPPTSLSLSLVTNAHQPTHLSPHLPTSQPLATSRQLAIISPLEPPTRRHRHHGYSLVRRVLEARR